MREIRASVEMSTGTESGGGEVTQVEAPRRALREASLARNPAWKIVGLIFSIVTTTASATYKLTKMTNEPTPSGSRGEHSTSSADVTPQGAPPAPSTGLNALELALKNKLGPARAQIVYQNYIRTFEELTPDYKEVIKYDVQFHDAPPPNTSFDPRLAKGGYYFYTATLDFRKMHGMALDDVAVGFVTKANTLQDWVAKRDILYREIISLNAGDEGWFHHLLDRVRKTNDPYAQLELLGSVFRVTLRIDDGEAVAANVKSMPGGLRISYPMRASTDWQHAIHYHFEIAAIQTRERNNFPMIISELTQTCSATFDYHDSSIKDLDYYEHWFTGPDATRPPVLHDPDNKTLGVTCPGQTWLFPGSGVFLYWSRS